MPNATQKLQDLAKGLREVKSESGAAQTNVTSLADAIDRISKLAPRLETGELGGMKEDLQITETAVRALDTAFREFGRSRTFINARQDVTGLISELNIANEEQRKLFTQRGFEGGRLTELDDTIRRIATNVGKLKQDLQGLSAPIPRTTTFQEQAGQARTAPQMHAGQARDFAYVNAEISTANRRLADQALILKDVQLGIMGTRQAYQELLGLAGGEVWELVTPEEVGLIAEYTTDLNVLSESMDIVSAAQDAMLTKHEQAPEGFRTSIEAERQEEEQIDRLVRAYDALIQRAEEMAIARKGVTVTVSRDPLGDPLEVQRRLPPTPNLQDIRKVEQSYFTALKGFPQNLVEELLGTETETALGKRLEQIFGERGVMTKALVPIAPRDVLVIDQAAAAMDRLAQATERVIRLGAQAGLAGGGAGAGTITLGPESYQMLPPGRQPAGLLGPGTRPGIPQSRWLGPGTQPGVPLQHRLPSGPVSQVPLLEAGPEYQVDDLLRYQDAQARINAELERQATDIVQVTQLTRDLTAAEQERGAVGGGVGGPPVGEGGERVTPADLPKYEQTTRIVGDVEQIKAALKDEEQVVASVEKAINTLKTEYATAGAEAKKFAVEIDAVNKAIRVQGQFTKDLPAPEGYGGFTRSGGETRQLVTDLEGNVINRAQEVQRAFEEMGRPTAFNNLAKEVDRLGLSFENLGPVQRDANEGLHRFNFTQKDALGATTRTTLTLDQQGKVAQTVKSKYETLGGAISNNINKVVRWGIAVGVVYGGMRRLQNAVTDMIDLQYTMADIQIITGRSAEDLGDALEDVAVAAEKTGTSLVDAISGYEKALRAAGEYRDENERLQKANELLGDSLLYARLSGLDVATAVDTLTGAMRQANVPIGESTQLLDKWVAVSKDALVNTADLGESFAITAAQALAVGVSVDQLNGLIATIAKTTTLSSTEIGNLARRILSAFERPEALESLEGHGIAIKDLEGEYRDFFDIVQDVYNLYRAGAISEKELAGIGAAFGGGARGGPQVVAIIKQWGEANRLAAVSAEADGDAAAALDIKMETLKGTTQELNVAMSKLITTAGGEGGFLSFLTNAVKLVTDLVNILGDLVERLGSTTTQLVAMGTAFAVISKSGIGARLGGSLGLASGGGRRDTLAGPGGEASAGRLGKIFGEGATTALSVGSKAAGYGIAAAVIGGLTTGDATSAIGMGIGGAIGGVLAGPLGATVGATIGGFIVGEIKKHEDEIKAIYERATETGYETMQQAQDDLRRILENYRDPIDRLTGKGPEGAYDWESATTEEMIGSLEAIFAQQRAHLDQLIERGIPGSEAGRAGLETRLQSYEEIIAVLRGQTPLLEKIEENTAEEGEPDPAAFAQRRAETERLYQPGIEQALEQQRMTSLQRFASGDTSRGDYLRFRQNQETVPDLAVRMIDTMGEEIAEAFGEGQGAIQQMAVDLSELDPEALKLVSEQVGELEALQRAIDEIGEVSNITAAELAHIGELEEEMGEKGAEAMQLILGLLGEVERQAQAAIPTGFTRMDPDLSSGQINTLIDQARQNQAEFAKFMGVSPKLLKEQAEDFVRVWGGSYHKIQGLHENFLEDVLRQFQEAQEKMQESQFSVRRLQDVGPEKFGEIQARNRYWMEYLARMQGMTAQQYAQEEGYEENLILGPNNVWQKILTTSEAMNFTLQDILETEKKQLEGMWNIPEGATFWVPITSLFNQRDGGAPGVPELPPLDELQPDPGTTGGDITTPPDLGIWGTEVLLSREEAMAKFGIPEPEVGEEESTNQRLYEIVTAMREMASERGMDPQEFAAMFLDAMDAMGTLGDSFSTLLGDILPGMEAEDKLGDLWEGLRENLGLGEDTTDLLREAASQLSGEAEKIAPDADEAQSLLQTGQEALVQAQGAYSAVNDYFTNPPPMSLDVTLEAEKELIVHNIINLDGSFIKRFVSEILASEVATSAKASGATITLKS